MKMMHTPGPWSIEPEWSERADGEVAIVNRDHSGDDWDVCSVHSTEANARVITAAPELLKALVDITGAYAQMRKVLSEMYPQDGWSADTMTIDSAEAAIAKATGASA